MLPPGEGGHLFLLANSQHYGSMGRARYIYRSMEWLNFLWAFHGSVNIQISPMDPVCGNGIQGSKEFVWFLFRKKKKTKKKKQNLGFGLTKSDFPFQQNQVLQKSFSGGGGEIQLTYTFIVPPLKKKYH